MLLVRLFLFALSFAFLGSAQRCDTGPCEVGCCNSNGWCGYGPDFCGDTCVSDCHRKSECNPGTFGSDWSKWATRDKCPLNVCCSKSAFCGTTEDFCGDKKVTHKTCGKSNGHARVVGYYEGWATNRACNVFLPEQIPTGIYTHINFAFAIIDPTTFKIAPSSPSDVNLYKRLMLLKQKDPSLKVYIAIGGWAFNDPGPTATTFSDLSASVPRQKVFMESLLSFMSTYGFDGVDLDWEYPVASERAGREVDFDNFPKFMARLKQALSGANKGLTITLPASYWYLQHFDLANLGKSVDWFNIMSYDLHGTWDQGNKWTGAFLNSHTNLTEIDAALDLLWRNDVDPAQVVLGLAFYGRTFSMTSETCNKPGCTYQSGGQRGRCSKEVGILLNSEIDDAVKEHSVTPVLYKKEAAKVAIWGNQWVAYDDEETFKMKSEYAQTLCLGGLMVWAISHDTKEAKYHQALAKAANRKILSLPSTDGSDDAFQNLEVDSPQCKWTNCGDSCPSGWVHIKRSDSRGKKDEYMYDESSCGPDGVHKFCCPPTSQPSCGWYTQTNGNCDSKCPTDMVEIGSYNSNCKKAGTYQSACCSSNYKSMKLYTKGEWGKYPMCEETSSCPAGDSKKKDLLGSASAGSGQAHCNAYYKGHVLPKDPPNERKFCYDGSNEKERFSDCIMFGGVGLMPSGAPKNWCLSGCPNNRVRIGMGSDKECANFSYRALCCVPNMSDTIQIENPKLETYRDALGEFMKAPRCEVPGPFEKRHSLALAKRELRYPYDVTNHILLALLAKTVGNSMNDKMEEAWNAAMGTRFNNLHFPSLRKYITGLHTYETQGPIALSHQIVCNLNMWNLRAAGNDTERTLFCYDTSCSDGSCDWTPDSSEGDAQSARDGSLSESLEFRERRLAKRHHHHHRHVHGHESNGTSPTPSVLIKRSNRDFTAQLRNPDGTTGSITVTLAEQDPVNEWPDTDRMMDEVLDYDDLDDCGNPTVTRYSLPRLNPPRYFETEHVFDGNLIARFMRDASRGELRSGATATTGFVSVSFFRQARTMPVLLGAPALPGGADPNVDPGLQYVFARVMECLGSMTNDRYFVALVEEIHQAKTLLMQGLNVIDPKKLQKKADSGIAAEANEILVKIRAAIAAIRYLSHTANPDVNDRLAGVINNVGAQWRHAQDIWNALHPNDTTTIGDFWFEWVKDFFDNWLIKHTRKWAQGAIDTLNEAWESSSDPAAQGIIDALTNLNKELKTLKIDTTKFKK